MIKKICIIFTFVLIALNISKVEAMTQTNEINILNGQEIEEDNRNSSLRVFVVESATQERLPNVTVKVEEIDTGISGEYTTKEDGIAYIDKIGTGVVKITVVAVPDEYKINPMEFIIEIKENRDETYAIGLNHKTGQLLIKSEAGTTLYIYNDKNVLQSQHGIGEEKHIYLSYMNTGKYILKKVSNINGEEVTEISEFIIKENSLCEVDLTKKEIDIVPDEPEEDNENENNSAEEKPEEKPEDTEIKEEEDTPIEEDDDKEENNQDEDNKNEEEVENKEPEKEEKPEEIKEEEDTPIEEDDDKEENNQNEDNKSEEEVENKEPEKEEKPEEIKDNLEGVTVEQEKEEIEDSQKDKDESTQENQQTEEKEENKNNINKNEEQKENNHKDNQIEENDKDKTEEEINIKEDENNEKIENNKSEESKEDEINTEEKHEEDNKIANAEETKEEEKNEKQLVLEVEKVSTKKLPRTGEDYFIVKVIIADLILFILFLLILSLILKKRKTDYKNSLLCKKLKNDTN